MWRQKSRNVCNCIRYSVDNPAEHRRQVKCVSIKSGRWKKILGILKVTAISSILMGLVQIPLTRGMMEPKFIGLISSRSSIGVYWLPGIRVSPLHYYFKSVFGGKWIFAACQFGAFIFRDISPLHKKITAPNRREPPTFSVLNY